MKTKKLWFEVADEFKEQYPEQFEEFVEETRAEGALETYRKNLPIDILNAAVTLALGISVSVLIKMVSTK